ncbi:MAG: RNA methyltransferase [Actinomycetota bacterium]|nr:RNA methyltransferase [Actinomycetota bacterium]
MNAEPIEDPADPRLADYVGLTDSTRRMRHEPEKGFFIAEGEPVMRRAAGAGYRPRSLLLSPQRLAALGPELSSFTCPCYVASYDVLEATTGFHVHRGALASFNRKTSLIVEQALRGATRVVVLEDVNNATNLGAIFRSAAGLGMDAVLLSPGCCDPLYRRAARVSMGEVFAVPYAVLEPWPAALSDLRDGGMRLLALTPSPDAVDLDALALPREARAALLLGAEGPGLTDLALALADVRVRIPMAAGVDSLNVGAAAAVACWVVGRR